MMLSRARGGCAADRRSTVPSHSGEARWLEDRIRSTCVDDTGRPADSDALACLQLADELAEDLDAGEHIEPIELGRSHAVGLTEYVLNGGAAAEHHLPAFYEALIRFRG